VRLAASSRAVDAPALSRDAAGRQPHAKETTTVGEADVKWGEAAAAQPMVVASSVRTRRAAALPRRAHRRRGSATPRAVIRTRQRRPPLAKPP
jgi:hypothetical protein